MKISNTLLTKIFVRFGNKLSTEMIKILFKKNILWAKRSTKKILHASMDMLPVERNLLYSVPLYYVLFFSLLPAFGNEIQTGAVDKNLIFSKDITAYVDISFADSLFNRGNRRMSAYSTQPISLKEVALNYGLVGIEKEEANWRGALGLHTGNYVAANYQSETTFNAIIEKAQVGLYLGKGIWFDAGIIGSHIGSEAAIHFSLPTLTRSLVAELSPYFESGVSLSYEGHQRLTAKLLYLNGWQKITNDHAAPAGGWQLGWQFSKEFSIISASFFGKTGSIASQVRAFHNLGIEYKPIESLMFNLVLDCGADGSKQNLKSAAFDQWNPFYGFSGTMRWQFIKDWAINLRAESYHDPAGTIVSIDENKVLAFSTAFRVWGASLGIEVAPTSNVKVRSEVRSLHSMNSIFKAEAGPTLNSASKMLKDELIISFSIAAYIIGPTS